MHTSFITTHLGRIVDSHKAELDSSDDSSFINGRYNHEDVRDAIDALANTTNMQKRDVLAAKVAISLYGESLETCLKQAIELDEESNWWREVESKRRSTAMYFLQTLPIRLRDLVLHLLHLFRESGPSNISFQSVKDFVVNSVSPSTVHAIIYPHLQSIRRPSMFSLNSPLVWTRQECSYKRRQLEQLRDDRAEILGELTELRQSIDALLSLNSEGGTLDDDYAWIMMQISSIMFREETVQELPSVRGDIPKMPMLMDNLSTKSIRSMNALHQLQLSDLSRPNRWLLLWPKIVLLPPTLLWLLKYLYASRESIWQTVENTQETLIGFWNGWIIEPIKDILSTVRTGRDDGLALVSRDSLNADLDSLERMTLSLTADKLGYNDSQLAELRDKIREGDLTPVLKIYEEDIKSPFKNLIAGSLVRSLLIQIQKTKVDIDLAMSGIDKLLRSQELTFAFVGVAPALAILYLTGGWLREFLFGKKERYGSRTMKINVWANMRRIERLLTSSHHATPERTLRLRSKPLRAAHSHSQFAPSFAKADLLPPLTNGLIILSLTHLRDYATNHLPPRSRLREGFLEDVSDLENPELGREEKKRVIDRMWRCWGTQLGWYGFR